jgi:uncharacterized protein
MLILVASLGYAFITASAIAKVVNVATNVGAIMVFGFNGRGYLASRNNHGSR